MESNLAKLNQEDTIKDIIDYLIDKLMFTRRDVTETWEIAKEYAKQQYPEYDEEKNSLLTDWSKQVIKVIEL